jgi:hypothetical protein
MCPLQLNEDAQEFDENAHHVKFFGNRGSLLWAGFATEPTRTKPGASRCWIPDKPCQT